MNIEKIKNLGPEELLKEQREAADQLFRLKFQLKMGQTTGVKKMRELRKELARLKTVARERELGILQMHVSHHASAAPPAPARGSSEAPTSAKPAAGGGSVGKAKKPAAKKKTAAASKKAATKKAGTKRKSKAKR